MIRQTARTNDAELRDGLAWVRTDTLSTLLVCTGAVLWLWLLTFLRQPDQFWPGWGTLGLLLIVVCVCFLLRQRYYLAAWLFNSALFTGVTAALPYAGTSNIMPFLYLPVVLLTGALLGPAACLVFAFGATVALLLVPATQGGSPAAGVLWTAIPLLWLAGLISWASTRNLLTALRWAWSTSRQAEQHLREAREYQAQLAGAKRQLEDANYRLGRANVALHRARLDAEEARRIKAQFAAHVSHELRTPINLVVGFAELMRDYPEVYGDVALPPAYLADLNALFRSAKHLKSLIDDILDLSQLDAGQMPVMRDVTEVGALIHEALAIAQPLAERKRLTLRCDVAPDLPMLSIDRLRIRQVLLNLLNNATRFTDHGGITVHAHAQADEVVIDVADTGIGLKAADTGRLFEAFRQLDVSPTRSRGGTGLGLAIAHRFVQLHGGRIWAASAGPGQGSNFGFAIPLAPAVTETLVEIGPGRLLPDRPDAAEPRRRADPTVVVLDEDAAVVGLFRRHLDGYRVLQAAGLDEAAVLAASTAAHAVLTAAAPADAERLQRQLDARPGGAAVRLLACPMPSGRRQARTLGVGDYLVKPVDRDNLLASLRRVAPQARRVLVVDDQPDMVSLLCRMLRSAPEPYQLLRAFSGEQAMEHLRTQSPDVVLLDLLMPEMDGFAVLERIRREPALALIPVIAVSAKGAFDPLAPSAARALTLVADHPFAVGELLRLVQTTLDALPPATETTAESPAAAPGVSVASG